MHEYYYTDQGDDGWGDADDRYADPNEYNMDLYVPVEGSEDLRDDFGENYYLDEGDTEPELIDPNDLGLADEGDGGWTDPANNDASADPSNTTAKDGGDVAPTAGTP